MAIADFLLSNSITDSKQLPNLFLKPHFEDNVFDTLLNPILVVEVLSPSTEAYDKGEKFRHYQELASLREYILVSQDRIRVEQSRLTKTQWVQTEFREPEDVLPLASIGCELPLRDIYRRVPEVLS